MASCSGNMSLKKATKCYYSTFFHYQILLIFSISSTRIIIYLHVISRFDILNHCAWLKEKPNTCSIWRLLSNGKVEWSAGSFFLFQVDSPMKVQLLLTNGALRVREEFCWNVVGNAHTVPLGFYSPTTGKSRAVFIGYETAFLHVGVFGYPNGPHVHSSRCKYVYLQSDAPFEPGLRGPDDSSDIPGKLTFVCHWPQKVATVL